jgi:hypothetical protein
VRRRDGRAPSSVDARARLRSYEAQRSRHGGARGAEVLAALSISIDLGLGLPMEHVLRSSLVAAILADELKLSEEQRTTIYYTNLVLWIGCHADSHEFSRWFGDDLAMRRDSYQLDWSGLRYMRFLMQRAGSSQSLPGRTQMLVTFLLAPRTRMAALIHSHCMSAGLMAERIGLERAVGEAVECAFERWDGSGLPGGRRGEDIPARDTCGPTGGDLRGASGHARCVGRARHGRGAKRQAIRPLAGAITGQMSGPHQRAPGSRRVDPGPGAGAGRGPRAA